MATADTIRTILAQHGKLPVDAATLNEDSDLYAAGLSSFASVQLMLAIEEEFDIEFPENLLNRKTFSTIATIVEVVTELSKDQQAA
ncbi:acyl carrier protein [Stappia taiwanensis]|uniref:Acyl carrier protein n=1 Tax=Stappia taiwanensis TaxID=992267 RepID=A0A838XS58_9HYPH|nr:acyl carrier protein [Stappia taiwanensis]MBA4612587.1 acyl carrier protein [Stappia taiwanensis]GGE89285.1 aminoacyl carrier protein [Stappia taiwanensis]